MKTQEIVQRLWNLCHVLRDDGITYHQYVTELTYLLCLKMANESMGFRSNGKPVRVESQLPHAYRWKALVERDGIEQLTFYREMLLRLGTESRINLVKQIFADAQTAIKHPRNLKKLVEDIDQLDWFSAKEEGLGDLYEGLLERNAGEKKSGAGQYFTPRPLINSIVRLVQPQAGEVIQDPAAGTGGFLIAADQYIKQHTDNHYDLDSEQQKFQKFQAFVGMELVHDTARLGLMNLLLHDIHGRLHIGDTLSSNGEKLPKVDVVLTNPPFGTKKGGGGPTRNDFTFPTSNKQLAFLQHIYRALKEPQGKQPGGRAAVVLPDNVLFEENTGADIRRDLMDKCELHTILRLPTGIFYAGGVKTNVLFFTRGKGDKANTKSVWIYDMRTNAPAFGKRTPLTEEHFADFEKCFGKDPYGTSKRKDQGEDGKFRKFTRDDIAKRGDNLDISWLKDDSTTNHDELPEPTEIADEIIEKLRVAMDEMEALRAELGEV
jgi:type I restriction enzyme M protein